MKLKTLIATLQKFDSDDSITVHLGDGDFPPRPIIGIKVTLDRDGEVVGVILS